MLARLRRHLCLALAAALLCAGAHAQDLRVGLGADVTSMDPHFVNLFPNNNIAEHVFEKLITPTPIRGSFPVSRSRGRRWTRPPGSSACAAA
jgi:ABC-type oligopeptide transport system substrate-binding subunit